MLVYEQVLFNLYHTLELLLGGTVVVLSGSFSRFEEHRTVTTECPGGPKPCFLIEYNVLLKIICQQIEMTIDL